MSLFGKETSIMWFLATIWYWDQNLYYVTLLLQDKFIKYLLTGTKNLTPALASNKTISHIINLSSAILLLSNNKCDLGTNPNPKVSSKQTIKRQQRAAGGFDFSMSVLLILSMRCSLCLKTCLRSFKRSHGCWAQKSQRRSFINIQQAQSTRAGEYPTCCTPTIYLWLFLTSVRRINVAERRTTLFLQPRGRWPQSHSAGLGEGWRLHQTPIILSTAVSAWRSQQYCHSGQSALSSSLHAAMFSLPPTPTQPFIPNGFSTSRQMATFNQNPHPSDDNITGTVCSLLISDGSKEIKLKHLTEMIEVRTVFVPSLTLLWIKEENVVVYAELLRSIAAVGLMSASCTVQHLWCTVLEMCDLWCHKGPSDFLKAHDEIPSWMLASS